MKNLLPISIFCCLYFTNTSLADNEIPPPIKKAQDLSREKMIEESAHFGDPAKPAEREFRLRKSYVSDVQERKRKDESFLVENNLPRGKESIINPIGPTLAAEMGCNIVVADVSGVTRRDDGKLSGYRTVIECDYYLLDIQENDYPQSKTQRVFTFIPAEAVNVDFGSGRAIARYFAHPKGSLMATFLWTNDKQEVLVQAISDPQQDALSWNLKMTDVARRVVAARNSQ